MDPRVANAFQRLLVRAATQAEDGTVASLSALERVCFMVAEETPALIPVATEYLWRKHRYSNPLEARDLVIARVLRHFEVESSVLSMLTAIPA